MLGRHEDFLVSEGFEKPFLLFIRTAFEKRLCLPVSIKTEPKVRMLFTHLHRLVDHPAVELSKFCLKIRIANVEMLMRNKKNRPLLCRLQRLLVTEILRVQFYIDL